MRPPLDLQLCHLGACLLLVQNEEDIQTETLERLPVVFQVMTVHCDEYDYFLATDVGCKSVALSRHNDADRHNALLESYRVSKTFVCWYFYTVNVLM